MDQNTSYIVFVGLALPAAVIALAVGVYAWRRRGAPGAAALAWMMFSVAGWLVVNTLEQVTTTEFLTLLFAKLGYIFIGATAISWFAVAFRYTGRDQWLNWKWFAILSTIPTITIVLALTNEYHHLIWTSYSFTPISGLLVMSNVEHGAWFWVFGIYLYVLMIWGAVIIFMGSWGAKPYRQQSLWLIVGGIAPLIANLIYVFKIFPWLAKDYSSLSFALAGAAYAIGIFRYGLFDLKPVARNLVVDNLTDAMLVLDDQQRIVDANPAARRLLGVADDTLIGKAVESVVQSWPELSGPLKSPGERRIEISRKEADERRFYDLRISNLKNERGAIIGRLVLLNDITDRKAAEVERERLIGELDAYAHTVAHELKNPIASVVGYAGLLQIHAGTRLDAEGNSIVSNVIRTSLKMTTIVDELLMLANIRQSRHVVKSPLSMSMIIEAARQRLNEEIKETNPEITLPAEWPSALGHALWIEEVWANYLSNAMKYGGTPPRIVLGATVCDNSTIRFWVNDNGDPLTAIEREQLFTPFARLSEARAAGHGLGLSIVERIVTRLGGEVGVESDSSGNTFYFTLPAAVESPAKSTVASAAQ